MPALPVNRAAQLDVRAESGTIPQGVGVKLRGDLSATGTYIVELPSAADGNIDAVIKSPPSDATDGTALQVDLSNAQLLLSGTVAVGDYLTTDANGRWQKVPPLVGASHCYYVAFEAGNSGDLVWAHPVGSRPVAIGL